MALILGLIGALVVVEWQVLLWESRPIRIILPEHLVSEKETIYIDIRKSVQVHTEGVAEQVQPEKRCGIHFMSYFISYFTHSMGRREPKGPLHQHEGLSEAKAHSNPSSLLKPQHH